ncbi:ABC transporter substrate-binding protein [Pseudooceanicola nitratireducens]|uniref:ABC transporter substrate-binding protein n=1 Tax=Pseudooceanicola nitratireducens TaxID=517719 RepID=UPI0023F0EB95|nr:ABC transporter substrate-binding protein [Pseudooceanicola nitratireducens]
MTIRTAISVLTLGAFALGTQAVAEPKYGPGASDAEVRIGNTQPYSGPASAYGVNGKMMQAVIAKANAEGGINGRQITFLSYDDAYNPAKTLEQVRRLVEKDEVLFIGGAVGTAQNVSIQRYLNKKEVPHLLVLSGGKRWNDPENYPWTTAGAISPYVLEGYALGIHATQSTPGAKIAVLYQNDDLGKEYLQGLEQAVADTDAEIVRSLSFEVADPTVDNQVISMEASGADTVMVFGFPKAVAQTIRKAADMGWQPARYIGSVGSVIQASLVPAGLENSIGIITTNTQHDASDPDFQSTQAYADYIATIDTYYPEGEPTNGSVMLGYTTAHLMLDIIEAAGDDLTRENIMRVATTLSDVSAPMMLDGVPLMTSPDNHQLVRGIYLSRFNGERYEQIGDLIRAQD